MNLNPSHNISLRLFFALAVSSVVLFSCGIKKKAASKEEQAQAKPLPDRSPSSAELIYKNNFYEALRLRTVGDLEESQKVLEWCLTQRPEDDAVLFLLATYAENNRRITKAREYIKKASEIDPNNIWYVELLARIQITSDDFLGAEQSFKRLVEYDRYNREWLYYYSETLIFNQKYAEAIAALSSLIDEVGPVPELVHQRNELYVELNRDTEMIASMKTLIINHPETPEFTSMLFGYYKDKKNLEQAERDFFEVLNQNTQHASARIGLADLYNMQGKQKKALEQLKLAFEANILEVESSIQVLLSVLERQTEIDPMALELALILQTNFPNNFMTHALVGEVYKQQGKKKEALTAFEKSLELNLDNYDLWLEVLATKYTMKRYDESLKKAEQALELFPSQPQVYYYAGMSALYQKSFTEALNYFETGKDYVVRDPAFKAQFELATAEVYLEQKNLPKARKHLESADYLAPNEKLLMNNRAYLMAKHKLDLDKALTLIQQAIVGNENDALFLDTHAWVHFARKEYELALDFITRAHKLAPNSAEINEHFGDILFKMGRANEALTYWIKAKDFGDESTVLLQKIQSKKLTD